MKFNLLKSFLIGVFFFTLNIVSNVTLACTLEDFSPGDNVSSFLSKFEDVGTDELKTGEKVYYVNLDDRTITVSAASEQIVVILVESDIKEFDKNDNLLKYVDDMKNLYTKDYELKNPFNIVKASGEEFYEAKTDLDTFVSFRVYNNAGVISLEEVCSVASISD